MSDSWPAIQYGGLIKVILVVLPVFFMPTIIAIRRGHHRTGIVLLLNLFTGPSGLGWGVALLWSIFGKKKIDESGGSKLIEVAK